MLARDLGNDSSNMVLSHSHVSVTVWVNKSHSNRPTR